MENPTSDSLREFDFVFAQAAGYVPWPGILQRKLLCTGVVQFMLTNGRQSIPYAKIWPYDDRSKEQFITSQNMKHKAFCKAIFIIEKLRSDNVDVLSESADWELESPLEVPPGKCPALEQRRAEWELNYVREVRLERDSLVVEAKFIQELNVLRRSLTVRKQVYPSALLALQELQGLALSELLLVRNFGAVEAINSLCSFASAQPQDRQEAEQVKSLANQLMHRFASHFKQPFSTSDFWSEYCLRSKIYRSHTADIKPN
ncbi:uncharacterized protein LOC108036896 isoform X2 [Drosophila biarmipes]|uniref:uncharacterized protein LOC108036896 isoform X2 n=1 Tax=Drosophila biarmipes TaxID=125945 RepID=UPI0021CC628F|nr:uncharacterized protein LOC108036896 isoform X2 [Drosophila biarmipes]